MSDHWVYILHEDHGGFIKIGRAGSFDRISTRLKQSQVGCPSRLSVIASIPPGDHAGESQIHRDLAKYRLRPDGEWFRGADTVYEYLGIQRPATPTGSEVIIARALAQREIELDRERESLERDRNEARRVLERLDENLNAMRIATAVISRSSNTFFGSELPEWLKRDAA